jgi:AraC-like DNA-binding protein
MGEADHADELSVLRPLLNVCDTEFYSTRDGFSAFREVVATAFMPWIIENKSESDFSARIVSLSGEFGSFSRTKMTPLTGIRTKSEISKSPERCLYANYVISGKLIVEQNGIVTTAEKGDLVIYDSMLPVRHLKLGDGPFEDLAFSISKDQIGTPNKIFENVAIPNAMIIAPLASCFTLLSQNISSASPDELGAIGAACAALLPVAGAHSKDAQSCEVSEISSNHYTRELINFINAHIGDIELSPGMAAENLGISVRYVHKQFAMRGTTFGKYVTAKRLELISHDLVSSMGRHQPIFALAFRWGFNDLSTFIRSFKKRFGCSPREYRSKF